jgi:5,10-methylene-tetrahydrofolate dehydrogenase/methenyl tetrahydrofolate cyclohydrolase
MSQGMSQARARDMALLAMEEANATRDIINKPTESRINRTKKNDVEVESEEIESAIEQPNFEEQSSKVGLNDLNEQLIQLNTSIRQLIEHSAETVETASKQVKATKRLSGNRFG